MKLFAQGLLLAFFMLGFVSRATAGDGGGTVQIQLVYNNNLLFFFTSQRNNAPACSSSTQKRWVMDISTFHGRAKYALLLSAQLSGKPVIISGQNNCSVWGDSETVDWVGFPVDTSQLP